MTAASTLENAQGHSFVLLQISDQRFALPAELVAELAPPVRLHSFPHSSPMLSGVIVRRGRILPVYDATRALSGRSSLAHRFYLVARRQFGEVTELGAIPVDGECELVSGDIQPPASDLPPYVRGTIRAGDETVGVLDIEALVKLHSAETAATEAHS